MLNKRVLEGIGCFQRLVALYQCPRDSGRIRHVDERDHRLTIGQRDRRIVKRRAVSPVAHVAAWLGFGETLRALLEDPGRRV